MIENGREGDDPGERSNSRDGSYKLDLYSIPVFLLEVIILIGLGYSAYYIHFQHQPEPLISGFYCDDITYRQRFVESNFINKFTQKPNELTITAVILTIPIVMIIFCELVNSMFGALSFRKIRALCACCKLHSITRRTLRFSAAYLLGFLIVMISCDILANSTGRLRPYFEQDCPNAYMQCRSSAISARSLSVASQIGTSNQQLARDNQSNQQQASNFPPNNNGGGGGVSSSINTSAENSASSLTSNSKASSLVNPSNSPPISGRIMKRQANIGTTSAGVQKFILERQWIDLSGQNLANLCNLIDHSPAESSSEFSSDNTLTNTEPRIARSHQLAMSWPSFPAAIFTYAILFSSCYLCFVGTARPFRLITCVLVTVLLLLDVLFNVHLVKEHYHHWEDVVASAVLAFVVVIFVLYVYLNKFRDTHYYENQKLIKPSRIGIHENFKGYSNDGAIGEFNHLDKIDGVDGTNEIRSNSNVNLQHADGNNGSISNNDLAMRYFQIPRANYRGAPRPLSSLNQML